MFFETIDEGDSSTANEPHQVLYQPSPFDQTMSFFADLVYSHSTTV